MTNDNNLVGEAPLYYSKKENISDEKIEKEIPSTKDNPYLVRICEMLPPQLWINGAKGTGKSHFLWQYALWILSDEFTIPQIINIDASVLKNKIQDYRNTQKIEIVSHFPDYFGHFFLEKSLKPLLQNAYKSYQEFILPKKISKTQYFTIEFQDFLSKNIQVESEMVEIFFNENNNKDTKNLEKKNKKNAKKENKKDKNNPQNTEKICLLGIEKDQLLYELYPQNTQTIGMVHYVEMQLLEELYFLYFYADKNQESANNITYPTPEDYEEYYHYKILEAFHHQKKENSATHLTKKMPSYILVLDNLELALEDVFWQNFLWAFSAKKRDNQEQYFVMPTGEKLEIPPNFYILCASCIWDNRYLQKAFLYDFALINLDVQVENIKNTTLKQFAISLNQLLLNEKGAMYCLGGYFFQSFLENFEFKNLSKTNQQNITNELDTNYLLNYIFDFYLFPYLKNLFWDISLEKLSQKLQQANIKNILQQQTIILDA